MGSLAWGEVRRRWRGAVAIGLVLGIGFAAVLLAAAGARRTETAYPRMVDASNTGDVLVAIDIEDPAEREQGYEFAAAAPGVIRSGRLAGVQLVPVEVPRGKGTVVGACADVSLDGVYGYDVDRPIVREGRLPDPRRADEVLIDPAYAELYGVGVGDRLDFVVVTGGDVPGAGETSPSDGAAASATIVGIGVSANQVVPFSDLEADPRVMAGPGFAQAHAPTQDSWCYDAAVLDLDTGVDPDSVFDRIEREGYPQFFQDREDGVANTRRAIQPQVTGLWLFAAVAAAATLLVVGQLLVRQLGQAVVEAGEVWRAVGLTTAQARTLLGAPVVVSAIAGALAATGVAIAFSGRFPIGPARVAEPGPGVAVHWWWHGLAPVAIVVVALALGAFFAWRSTRGREPSTRVGWLARLGSVVSSPSAVVGLYLAGGSGGGRSAVPVRSAAAGAALSLAAATAAVTFAAGLDDLVSEPARYGRDWDVMVDGLFGPVPIDSILDTFADDPDVEAIAIGRYGEVTIAGERVPTIGLSDVVGTTFPAVIDGRTPVRADEIVVGKTTLHALRRSVGDVVTFDAGDGPRDTTIVGTAAFPKLNHGSFSTLALGVGAMARTDAFPPRALPPRDEFPPGLDPDDFVGPDGTVYEFATVRLRDGASDAARRRVIDILTPMAHGAFAEVRTEQRPAAIDNYAAVRSTPFLLVLLLSGMAAATLGHLVVSVVRRRRHDLAMCSALGMPRRQVLGAVVLQALLIAGVALVVALPSGIAGGRLAWRGFSRGLGVADVVVLPLALLGIGALAVAAASMSVAGFAGYLTARQRPAAVLRSE